MPDPPRILIVTAAFGEGHNSAARNLALALESAGALTRVSDPCLLGMPRVTEWLSCGYRFATTRLPQVWAWIYRSTDRCDFSRQRGPMMRWPERALAEVMDEFQPVAVVSTYPLYPYFLARIFAANGRRLPVFTVVTDSIEINAAWLRAPTDWWLVTDPLTRVGMLGHGLAARQIIETGFAVHPGFADLVPISADDACEPFRVLYFPTAQHSAVVRNGRALLDASPAVSLTLVLGRNVRRLARAAGSLKAAYPGRVRVIGWTRKVPQLLSGHHLVVGKAGGATVHEALAARCPMLIHHLVPGQEEGNLRLLEVIGGGGLADSSAELTRQVAALLADQAHGWRAMKTALEDHGRNAGAIVAARVILNALEDGCVAEGSLARRATDNSVLD